MFRDGNYSNYKYRRWPGNRGFDGLPKIKQNVLMILFCFVLFYFKVCNSQK